MPDDLLLHPTTRRALDAYITRPPHAILLVGPVGIGKLTLAHAWANSVSPEPPQVLAPDERGTITIEMVRQLYRAARTRHETRQVIIIDHAEAMSLEAENALLKLLEEPRDGVSFVLCVPHLNALIPTIISRAQPVTIQPISDNILKTKLAAESESADITQALFIARGRPALFKQLLTNPEQFEIERDHMRVAKTLLAAKPYERYVVASKLGNDRINAIATLEAMQYMAGIQLQHASLQQQTNQWLNVCRALEITLQQLQRNGNVRAQLLRLFASY